MNLKKLLFLVGLFFVAQIQAQDLRIKVNEKGKVGFADKNGGEVIKCQYESALPFYNGSAIVSKSGKYGLIDQTGTVVLPLQYSKIEKWTDNLYLITKGNVKGLAEVSGKIIVPVKYSNISKLNSYGRALISLGGKPVTSEKNTYMYNAQYGIINANGEICIQPIYKGLYEFSFDGTDNYPLHEGYRLQYSPHYTTDTLVTDCKYLGFSKNGQNILKSGIINDEGQELIKQGLYDYIMRPYNGMARYYILQKKSTQCGYYNLDNGEGIQVATFQKPFVEMNYWSHGDFTGDIAPVNGTTWSFVDKSGKVLRQNYTSLAHSQHLGFWVGKTESGKCDVFDEQNKDIKQLCGYNSVLLPVNADDQKIFAVEKDNKFGVVDLKGDTVIPFIYDKLMANNHNFFIAKGNNKCGIITAANDTVVPLQYIDLIVPSEKNATQFWVTKSDSLYYHFNSKTQALCNKGFKYIENFKNGIAYVIPVDMKVEDNQTNKSLLFDPNTKQEEMDKVDLAQYNYSFGYFINENDEFVFNKPISVKYRNIVREKAEAVGNRALTDHEQKCIILDITRSNRSYDLKSVLSEAEWNY